MDNFGYEPKASRNLSRIAAVFLRPRNVFGADFLFDGAPEFCGTLQLRGPIQLHGAFFEFCYPFVFGFYFVFIAFQFLCRQQQFGNEFLWP